MVSFELSDEQIAELPIDELALEILSDIDENREWNSYNWMNSARSSYSRESLRSLAEAIGWLYSKGLLARDYGQSASDAIFVTRLGKETLENGARVVRATERLNVELHSLLERKVRRQFLMGEYELAAFAAMREVEIRVRELAGRTDSDLGVKLMRAAFAPDGGTLSSPTMDRGEQVARMDLFAGAIGMFKNPTSHREVRFDDPTEAAEVVLFADLLMRILDRIE